MPDSFRASCAALGWVTFNTISLSAPNEGVAAGVPTVQPLLFAPCRYCISEGEAEKPDQPECAIALPALWYGSDTRPCFALGVDGALRSRNGAAGELIEQQVLVIRDGALSFGRPEADQALMEVVEALARGEAECKRLVVLGQDDIWRGLTLHAAPFGQPLIFVSVRSQARTDKLATEALIEAFHLTPAQANVVAGLAGGLVPKEIARRMDVSTHTVRAHLRAIYSKLKVRGIAGVLRLTSQLLD